MIGGLGIQELLIVLVVALFLFGGKKLPDVGRSLGKAIRGFKEGTEEGAQDPGALKREGDESDMPDDSDSARSNDEGKAEEAK